MCLSTSTEDKGRQFLVIEECLVVFCCVILLVTVLVVLHINQVDMGQQIPIRDVLHLTDRLLKDKLFARPLMIIGGEEWKSSSLNDRDIFHHESYLSLRRSRVVGVRLGRSDFVWRDLA